MAITLDGLTLPPELLWQDELAWTPVAASAKRTLQGRLVVHAVAGADESGRPITLGNEHAWIGRDELLQLQGWAAELERVLELRLHDGSLRRVCFRHWEPPVLEAAMLFPVADPAGGERYHLNALRLVVV